MSERSHESVYYVGGPDPEYIAQWHANLKARKLYDRGVTFPGISAAIAEYHGIERTKDQWRDQMRKMGAPRRPKRGGLPERARG